MKIEEIVVDEPGKKLFLLGNEAIVRGFIEGDGKFAATYPGTPSSEIGDTISKVGKLIGINFEFSTNEKVAFEVAASAALSRFRSITFMKHVGLNVAMDSFMTSAYIGTIGGFIIITCDDPSMFSSQNEQDNRILGKFANIPILEPRNPDEARKMIKYGFEISEKYSIPLLLRTTTRISHLRGIVHFEKIEKVERNGYFNKNPNRFVPVPSNARVLHKELINKINLLRKEVEESIFNFKLVNNFKYGIITSGVSSNYVIDIVKKYSLPFDILSLGFIYPYPEELIKNFIKNYDTIYIIEELEPFIEDEVRIIKEKNNLTTKILGKDGEILNNLYEYNPDRIKKALFKFLGKDVENKQFIITDLKPPVRPPVLCAGCPHRATYYSVFVTLRKNKIKDAIFPSDIGCYSLGLGPPFNMADVIYSMGSSVGTSNGLAKSTNQKVISFIGDSTFFHAGIPALINAKYNKNDFILIILDNRTTAMTGHQPNPGMGIDAYGNDTPIIEIEEIVKGIGIDFVKVVDPYNLKETQKVIDEALKQNGVKVIISRRECSLLKDARLRKEGVWKIAEIDEEKCRMCKICINQFSCPAIYLEDDKIKIDEKLCDGCGVCVQVCLYDAIEVK